MPVHGRDARARTSLKFLHKAWMTRVTKVREKMPAWDKFAWFWRLRSRHACRRALDHRPHPPVHVPPIQQI